MIASVTRLPIITGRRMVVLVDPATREYQIDWDRSALVAAWSPRSSPWLRTTAL